MNETANEQLSALMDGELPRDELRFLIRGLAGDAGLVQRWSRYQVARAVLQHEYVPAATGDDRFAAAVLLRLEPAQPRLGRRIGRWAGGGAIAAAVAVIALMATRPAGENGALPAPGATADLATLTPMLLSPQQPAPASQARQQPVFVPMPAMPATFSDTQPASFESFLPRYTTNPRGSAQNADATPNGFVPYILMMGSRPKAEVQAAAGQDAPPPPQQ
jgi:sigma-E factor negative regulatory protein RseA